jgi:hypothetical protein
MWLHQRHNLGGFYIDLKTSPSTTWTPTERKEGDPSGSTGFGAVRRRDPSPKGTGLWMDGVEGGRKIRNCAGLTGNEFLIFPHIVIPEFGVSNKRRSIVIRIVSHARRSASDTFPWIGEDNNRALRGHMLSEG